MFVAFFCTLETNKSNASQCVFNQAWSFKDFSIAFNSAHSAVYFILSHQILEKSYFLYYSEFRCLTCYMACLKIYEKKSFTYLKSFILFGVTWELSLAKNPQNLSKIYILYISYILHVIYFAPFLHLFFFFFLLHLFTTIIYSATHCLSWIFHFLTSYLFLAVRGFSSKVKFHTNDFLKISTTPAYLRLIWPLWVKANGGVTKFLLSDLMEIFYLYSEKFITYSALSDCTERVNMVQYTGKHMQCHLHGLPLICHTTGTAISLDSAYLHIHPFVSLLIFYW